MLLNKMQVSLDSALESFGIISTISPVVLSNDIRNSLVRSISKLIDTEDFDELDLEHIYYIVSYLLNIIEDDITYDTFIESA